MSTIETLETELRPDAGIYLVGLRLGLTTPTEIASSAARLIASGGDDDLLVDLAAVDDQPAEDVVELIASRLAEVDTSRASDAWRLAAIVEAVAGGPEPYALDSIWHLFGDPDDMAKCFTYYQPEPTEEYLGQAGEARRVIDELRARLQADPST